MENLQIIMEYQENREAANQRQPAVTQPEKEFSYDDMTVNPTKNKKLTNVRASGTDEAMNLTPVQPMTLEQALEYIADDELVEVTPTSIRLRKKILDEVERKRATPKG